MASKKHLTLNDRIIIETMVNQKASFQDIADAIAKNPTSVYSEVRSHLIFRRIGSMHLNYNTSLSILLAFIPFLRSNGYTMEKIKNILKTNS